MWESSQCEPVVLLLLLQAGVVSCGAPLALLEALVLLVAAVVLLDEDGGSAALLETLLLVVGPELGLDQDGRLGHLLVEGVLREHRDSVSHAIRRQTSQLITAVCADSMAGVRGYEDTPAWPVRRPQAHHTATSCSRDTGCFQLLRLF